MTPVMKKIIILIPLKSKRRYSLNAIHATKYRLISRFEKQQ